MSRKENNRMLTGEVISGIRCQVSAQPLAKQTTGQIEKETDKHPTSNKGILSILIAVTNRSHSN
jgi:hypothetical protein